MHVFSAVSSPPVVGSVDVIDADQIRGNPATFLCRPCRNSRQFAFVPLCWTRRGPVQPNFRELARRLNALCMRRFRLSQGSPLHVFSVHFPHGRDPVDVRKGGAVAVDSVSTMA